MWAGVTVAAVAFGGKILIRSSVAPAGHGGSDKWLAGVVPTFIAPLADL